jgi:predicted ATPase
MVIAGPNGAGKTTLLNALRWQPGQGPILYVGPHRNTRRQVVRWRNLLYRAISLEELHARNDTPSYEGVQFFTGARDAWGFDDTANYLKHGLCQIEVDRKDAIADRYDRDRHIAMDALPNPWAPLEELTNNLLPHLSFDRVDASNKEQVLVLWRAHAKDTVVDFDDLSSGEKSIIQIFYPLVEARIKGILREIQRVEAPQAHPEICVLIDEPELHLHPNLQVKVFDYLRLLTSRGRIQVVIATHSPTIVEYASSEELYLLRPVESVAAGENQLVQVANDETRLQFLRDTFGATSNLTALQPIIVVEGADQGAGSRTVSDRKLYRALHPGFDRVTVVAGGGKPDCIRLRESLQKSLLAFSSKIRAVALLDRDLATGSPPGGVEYLPVSMIENFLLDPDAIWEAIQSVVERTEFKSIDDVSGQLDASLDARTEAEIDRRVVVGVGRHLFQPRAPLAQIPTEAAKFAQAVVEAASAVRVGALREVAHQQIAALKSSFERREQFHGKEVLAQFFKAHVGQAGMPLGVFRYETARHARRRKKVINYFDDFFRRALPEVDAPRVADSRGGSTVAPTVG